MSDRIIFTTFTDPMMGLPDPIQRQSPADEALRDCGLCRSNNGVDGWLRIGSRPYDIFML